MTNETVEAITKPKIGKIVFKIQILAVSKPVHIGPFFKGMRNVEENFEDGLYKYTVGETSDFEHTNTVTLNQVLKNGFKDAFVMAFEDGERITIEKALELLKK